MYDTAVNASHITLKATTQYLSVQVFRLFSASSIFHYSQTDSFSGR